MGVGEVLGGGCVVSVVTVGSGTDGAEVAAGPADTSVGRAPLQLVNTAASVSAITARRIELTRTDSGFEVSVPGVRVLRERRLPQ